jgi:photosynthetic reaction center cytochrome c subunit
MLRRSRLASVAAGFPASLAAVLFLFGLVASPGQTAKVPSLQQNRPTQMPVESSGAQRCVFCHRDEVEGYARSAMAHSLRRAGDEPDGLVNANGSKITMHSSSAGFFQRWENGGDETEYRVDYVIGSGNHASGYLVDLGGHLFQSPVAYYTSRHSYDLAPGYENQPDPDFTRPVSEECLLCHSGNALHIPGTLNQYRSPVFSAQGITCERCHGPVEWHLAEPRAGTIVNPAKLAPAARDGICEQCHLFGVARVPNPGKSLSDFVPGKPLEDTFTIYHDANPTGTFKVISHVEQLALSQCARNSGGRLWCGSCHNPHAKPTQPVEYYRSRCLSCHTSGFSATHPSKDSNCIGCHMPRRAAKDGGHSAFTDHRIQRRPGTLPDLPPADNIVAWREPAPDLAARNLGIADIEVGLQRHSTAMVTQGYRDLTDVQRQFSTDPDFFRWIGEALMAGRQFSEAEIALERAVQLDPDSAEAEARAAAPYIQDGSADRAIAHLQRAVALDPLNLSAASALTDLYRKQGMSAESAGLSAKITAQLSLPAQNEQVLSARSSSKPAGEVFKNIQVLKGVPSGQLLPTMRFISSSLDVNCSFCHVEGHFEKDDKKPKQTARQMMQMMLALDKNSFDGQRAVTCYSCHRGALRPAATPVIADASKLPALTNSKKLAANAPTVRQLLARYIDVLGGAAAIERISSRVEKGSVQTVDQTVGIEIFTKAPGKQTVTRHLPTGESVDIFDGRTGWLTYPGRGARSMDDAELASARIDADLAFPLHIQDFFPEVRLQYSETVEGREAYVLRGSRQGQPPVLLYFDAESGLLVRMVRYAESPLGLDPMQTDYTDYREVDGVQLPFRMTISEPDGVSITQLHDVQQNVPIDDAEFSKPAWARSRALTIPRR